MKRHFAIALLIAFVTACGSDEDPTDYLTLAADMNDIGGQVSMQVEQPGRTSNISNAQFAAQATERIIIPTARSGNLRVAFAITGTANDTLSTGVVQLGLQKGFIYSVTLRRRPANFVDVCFGCTGSAKYPIRDTRKPTTDSLVVLYSASPLCKGCVY